MNENVSKQPLFYNSI